MLVLQKMRLNFQNSQHPNILSKNIKYYFFPLAFYTFVIFISTDTQKLDGINSFFMRKLFYKKL